MANAIARKWLAVTLVLLALGFSPLAHSLCVAPHASGNHIHEMFDPMAGSADSVAADGMSSTSVGALSAPVPSMNLASMGEIVLYLTPALIFLVFLLLALASSKTKRCNRVCLAFRATPTFRVKVWPPDPPDLNTICISRV